MSDDRLPTELWIDAHLRHLAAQGIPYYILNRGAYAAGTVLLKARGGAAPGCLLLIQQRDIDGNLGWTHALGDENPDESRADDYIRRAVSRDPDLWVIEIEDPSRQNPFAGKVF
jgi:hypothetical protein